MAFNILDAVKGYFTPDLIDNAASYLGESNSTIDKAVNAVVPAALAGIIGRAESGGASSILDLAGKALNSGIVDNLSQNFRTGGGGIPDVAPSLLGSIFGDKVGSIGNAIASFAGIKGSSAASLLGSIAPLALGLLGRHASQNGWNASGLLSFLSGQKSSIMAALPAGLNLAGLIPGLGGSQPEKVHHAMHPAEPEKKSGSWLMPLLLGLAAVALLLYLMKGCGKEPDHTMETPVVSTPDTATTMITPATPARESLKVILADSTEIDAYRGGIEDQLVACLNNSACEAGKDQWYDFDNINFEVGSARLTPESQAQVNNIAAILKAYPKAKIKIGGYTDKTGDAAANKKLSQDRADAVMNAIKAAGANASQLVGAEGYGSEFAKVAAEASDEERRVDRRISVSLREK